jgi:hypothetical protein
VATPDGPGSPWAIGSAAGGGLLHLPARCVCITLALSALWHEVCCPQY